VLFNTLTYAKFFAIVFVVSWLLVRRSSAILLPYACVFSAWALGLHAPPSDAARLLTELGLLAIAGAATAALARSDVPANSDVSGHVAPEWRRCLASCALNFALLVWLSRTHASSDVISKALASINFVVPEAQPLSSTLLGQIGSGVVMAAACWFLMRARRIRLLFILGASYVFYANWDWRFLPLIFGSSTLDYWLGRKIGDARIEAHRKRWLWLTVFVNLGVLAIFKYLDFGVHSARAALHALGVDVPEWSLRVALPVGISFFTFESMSYVIDVYRREIPVHRSYLEYLSFVAFFPHLVAGPIVRPRDLLPQLANKPRFSAIEGSEGLFLIAWGLIKKVAIGDYLALNLVDRVFDQPILYSSLECYVAVIAYAVQIYCDFSGYTDVAIGSALLLGVRFPPNFNAPYKASSIQDFWRRWHISLSTWLRDYLYVPLGGNRKGAFRTYLNLLLTMLLGGLWHGASFTFVIWGALHGAALAVERAFARNTEARRAEGNASPWRYWLGVFFTFHFVCAAWIFFRAPNLDSAKIYFVKLTELSTYAPNLHTSVLGVLAIGLFTHFAPERWHVTIKTTFTELPALTQAVALCIAALLLREMVSAEAVPFVYFQF
jgi:D-alanyl-lipoteichoic acid acyltransferase DltB (MBOAT superfamily)